MLTNTIYNLKDQGAIAVLPVIYVVLAFAMLLGFGDFYLHGPDPVYAYLLNGVNLASGNMVIGHADHPGTPVQCMAAIIIFMQHLFCGSGTLHKDVLLNPESYLFTISVVSILLLGIATYYCGTYIFNYTGSLALAILFQAIPVCEGVLFDTILLRPEALIIIAGTLFAAYSYIIVIKQESKPGKIFSYKTAIISGILTAFLIACKFTCAPLAVLVLFFLSTYKERLAYLLVLVISFFVFIFPAHAQMGYMWEWLIRLATHDERYGFGKNQIVSLKEFKGGVTDIFFGSEIIFPLSYCIITIAFIMSIVKLLKKNNPDKPCAKAITGIWLCLTLFILMVSKHYAFYYLRPAQMCLPIGLALSHKIFSNSANPTFYTKYRKPILAAVGILLFSILMPKDIHSIFKYSELKKPFLQTQQFLKTYKNVPVIIASEGRESAFLQPSLFFGTVYTGNLKHKYFQFLQDTYPNSYIYLFHSGDLYSWDEEIITPQIFCKSSRVLVYFNDLDHEKEENILNKICTVNELKLATYRHLYSDSTVMFNENIYEINADTTLAKKLMTDKKQIFCDLETMNSDKTTYTSSDGQYHFRAGGILTHGEHHSGTTSVEMNKDKQYSLDMVFKAIPGSFISASVWRKAQDGEGGIVIQGQDFYKGGSALVGKNKNGWQQIEANCLIPKDYKGDSLHFYLYYPQNDTAYFDDVSLTIYPMNKNRSDSLSWRSGFLFRGL